jgi:hypothetical protein
MDRNIIAEVRFPDDGTAALGVLIRIDPHSATIRLIERIAEDLFAYGKAGVLTYPDHAGQVSVPCRLVAEYGADFGRDLFVVLTSQPTVTDRRMDARVKCSLEAVYRAVHDHQSFGAWAPGTVVDIGPEGIALRVPVRDDFPPQVEVQITLPETFRGTESRLRQPSIIRNRVPLTPESERPIRLRADVRNSRSDGPFMVYGIQFLAVPDSVKQRLSLLLSHLAGVPANAEPVASRSPKVTFPIPTPLEAHSLVVDTGPMEERATIYPLEPRPPAVARSAGGCAQAPVGFTVSTSSSWWPGGAAK